VHLALILRCLLMTCLLLLTPPSAPKQHSNDTTHTFYPLLPLGPPTPLLTVSPACYGQPPPFNTPPPPP